MNISTGGNARKMLLPAHSGDIHRDQVDISTGRNALGIVFCCLGNYQFEKNYQFEVEFV